MLNRCWQSLTHIQTCRIILLKLYISRSFGHSEGHFHHFKDTRNAWVLEEIVKIEIMGIYIYLALVLPKLWNFGFLQPKSRQLSLRKLEKLSKTDAWSVGLFFFPNMSRAKMNSLYFESFIYKYISLFGCSKMEKYWCKLTCCHVPAIWHHLLKVNVTTCPDF